MTWPKRLLSGDCYLVVPFPYQDQTYQPHGEEGVRDYLVQWRQCDKQRYNPRYQVDVEQYVPQSFAVAELTRHIAVPWHLHLFG